MKKKKILMTVLALSLTIGMGFTTYASGLPAVNFASDGNLQYTNQSAITTIFGEMVPGVTENLDITLQNSNSHTASYYIEAKDIVALGINNDMQQTGAYDVVVRVGAQEIYNSTIGGFTSSEGDGTTNYDGTAGLGELDALKDWVYLTTLSPGQTANLRFALTMDGVSNGDQYQNSEGSIDFDFAVAYNEAPGTTTENNVVTTTGAKKKNIVTTIQDIFVPLASGVTAVKTGDPAAIGVLVGIGAIGAMGLYLTRRKKSAEDVK